MSDHQIERILADPSLSREILERVARPGEGRESLESNLSPAARLRNLIRDEPGLEKIVRATGRPVLTVRKGTFDPPTTERWRRSLEGARKALEQAILSVGRVELHGDPDYQWAGTAWVVGDGLIITNRHVCEIFARRDGSRLVFRRKGGGGTVSASIDFQREHESDAAFVIPIDGIAYLAPDSDDAPDVALLRLAPGVKAPPRIDLCAAEAGEGREVAVIGYPAYDYDEDHKLQEDLFAFYDVKRLAPGEVMGIGSSIALEHDCSTLGGNSGSVVLDLKTGDALGLHYAGRSGKANYAVRAAVIHAILEGAAQPATLISQPAEDEAPKPRVRSASELAGRAGYDPRFLGIEVPVPQMTGGAAEDVAPIEGSATGLLDYTHFSVAMSRSRRLARFTAVNIDGRDLRRIVRKGDAWFLDGRLPAEAQVGNDVYAKNKLDRGHLVRRLDPVWGAEAALANEDTFHFTNACPQHGELNQKTWRALEDYILENADAHELRVSVFTGPVFRETDRDYRDVRLPEEFWKVVVMLREPGNELVATAYLLTQRHLLSDIEFVFGPFRTYQVPVAAIEKLASLDFRTLREHDPLATANESVRRAGRAIEGPEDLVLHRGGPADDWAAIGAAFARDDTQAAFHAARAAVDGGETMPPDVLGRALAVLKKNCRFETLVALADLTGVFDGDQPEHRKIACQGLIELKEFARAIRELEKTHRFLRARLDAPPIQGDVDDTDRRLRDGRELPEVDGLLGRTYKQRLVDNPGRSREVRAADAARSLQFYGDAYRAARMAHLWHGINYVAVARYVRKHLGMESPYGAPEEVAREILRTIDHLEERGLLTDWDYATRGEAALATDDPELARQSYATFVARAGDNQFMRRSPLRQLRELWELLPTHPLMQLFSEGSGGAAGVPPAPEAERLQMRQGSDAYQLPEDDPQARMHARSVVRIGEEMLVGDGTGFIFDGAFISKQLAGKRLVLTCRHVCPVGVTPDRAVIIFFSSGERAIIYGPKMIWTSPELDASLLLIGGGLDDAKPAPLAKQAVQENDDALIIGHPLGGAKFFSRGKISRVDPMRFYYGTPTDPGFSGSPVFNGQWELTGLHRAGGSTANQGGRLDQIVKALRGWKEWRW